MILSREYVFMMSTTLYLLIRLVTALGYALLAANDRADERGAVGRCVGRHSYFRLR